MLNRRSLNYSALAFLLLLIATSAISSSAQQQPASPTTVPQQERIVVISFLVPIDSGSVNALLRVVTDQMRMGVKKAIIIISSPGGDPGAAFAAYNVLKHLPIEITTFNVGNIDSAAMLLYCAGQHRYSLPNTRFLIHGNSVQFAPNVQLDTGMMTANLEQLKNLNQMLVQVISAVVVLHKTEVENAVHSQLILTADQARQWGLVQDIRETFMEPGAEMISVNTPPPQAQPTTSPQFTSISAEQHN